MAMSAGNVDIDAETGEASGDGMAMEIYGALEEIYVPDTLELAALIAVRNSIASLCNVLGSKIVNYIKDNAVVNVTVNDIQSGNDIASGSGTVS